MITLAAFKPQWGCLVFNKNIDLNKNIVFQKPGGNEKIDGM